MMGAGRAGAGRAGAGTAGAGTSGPGMAWMILATRTHMVEIVKSFMISQEFGMCLLSKDFFCDFDDVGI